jgi:hypothetical protein
METAVPYNHPGEEMNTTVHSYLGTVGLLDVSVAGNIAIVQLGGTDPRYPSVMPYSTAHEKGLVEITERKGSVSVPEIEACNNSGECVLILEGEVLLGAKQNRTLNTTVLLPPKSTTVVPVSCVERGRWSGTAEPFRPSGTFVTPDIRGIKSMAVLCSLTKMGTYRSNQAEVWEEVSARISNAKIRTATQDYSAFEARAARDAGEALNHFQRRTGAVGVVGFIGARIVGCDILPNPGVFAQYFDQLVRSYSLDGGYSKSGPARDVNYAEESGRFLARLRDAETKSFASPGLGTSVQFRSLRPADVATEGGSVCGSALIHDGCIIHLGAFSGGEGRSDAGSFRRGFAG